MIQCVQNAEKKILLKDCISGKLSVKSEAIPKKEKRKKREVGTTSRKAILKYIILDENVTPQKKACDIKRD